MLVIDYIRGVSIWNIPLRGFLLVWYRLFRGMSYEEIKVKFRERGLWWPTP